MNFAEWKKHIWYSASKQAKWTSDNFTN